MVKQFSYGRKFDYNDVKYLTELFWTVNTKKQLQYLLMALFTHQELEEAVRRLLVGKMLANGETYEEIRTRYRMSNTTINSIYKRLRINPVFKKFISKP